MAWHLKACVWRWDAWHTSSFLFDLGPSPLPTDRMGFPASINTLQKILQETRLDICLVDGSRSSEVDQQYQPSQATDKAERGNHLHTIQLVQIQQESKQCDANTGVFRTGSHTPRASLMPPKSISHGRSCRNSTWICLGSLSPFSFKPSHPWDRLCQALVLVFKQKKRQQSFHNPEHLRSPAASPQ